MGWMKSIWVKMHETELNCDSELTEASAVASHFVPVPFFGTGMVIRCLELGLNSKDSRA